MLAAWQALSAAEQARFRAQKPLPDVCASGLELFARVVSGKGADTRVALTKKRRRMWDALPPDKRAAFTGEAAARATSSAIVAGGSTFDWTDVECPANIAAHLRVTGDALQQGGAAEAVADDLLCSLCTGMPQLLSLLGRAGMPGRRRTDDLEVVPRRFDAALAEPHLLPGAAVRQMAEGIPETRLPGEPNGV